MYDRCALPILEPLPGVPHAIPTPGYAVHMVHPDGATEFQHTRCVPLQPPPPPPMAQLSRAFHGAPPLTYMPPQDNAPPASDDDDDDEHEGGHDEELDAFFAHHLHEMDDMPCSGGVPEKKKKKRKQQKKRQAPAKKKPKKAPVTNGQMRREAGDLLFRTYKLRMLPSPAQRAELLRTFGIVADVFNWGSAMVRTGRSDADFRRLRERFNAQQHGRMQDEGAPPPVDVGVRKEFGWDTRVAAIVRAYALKEFAEAYWSNPGHPPGDRRMDLSDGKATATFTLEKYSHSTHGLVSFANARRAQRHKPDVVDGTWGPHERRARGRGQNALTECDMFLGSNFGHLGPIRVQDKARHIHALVAEGDRLKENGKILWDKRTGAFYFLYLRALPKPVDPDPDFLNKRVVAMDPGCRPFQAWYSPTTGSHGTVLAGLEDKIKARRRALNLQQQRVTRRKADDKRPDAPTSRARRERLQTAYLRAKARAHTTRRMAKRLIRERIRFNNWIAAAHYDAANFMLHDHDVVIQPKLAVQRLVAQAPAQAIGQRYLDLAHFAFRQRLISKAALYPGRHVLESIEPGTSRTCTLCGFWKADLAVTDKIFHCPHCNLCVDRQVAGARNNFFAAYGMATGIGWDGVAVGVGAGVVGGG